MGVAAQVNRRFLIGQAVDSETTEGIKAILMSRGSIEQLHQVILNSAAVKLNDSRGIPFTE